MMINDHDCGTESGLWVRRKDDVAGQAFWVRVIGRALAAAVYHPKTGELIGERNDIVDEDRAEAIDKSGIEEVFVRSPMTCEMRYGMCQMCYGRDLGRGHLVELGSAVGVVAAQSIGEPGRGDAARSHQWCGGGRRYRTVCRAWKNYSKRARNRAAKR
jgi:DNA-directed RNA polymerase subunit beta'